MYTRFIDPHCRGRGFRVRSVSHESLSDEMFLSCLRHNRINLSMTPPVGFMPMSSPCISRNKDVV